MSVSYITNETQFNAIFQTFVDDSKVYPTSQFHQVGLDCEFISKSNYPESFELSKQWTKNQTYEISVCILQLASKNVCLIIDLKKFFGKLPEKLVNILKSENWLKTGVNISTDMKYLVDNFDLGHCNGIIDISVFANLAGCKTPNLKFLFDKFENVQLKKTSSRFRDWSNPLTTDMINYCANDGFASFLLGQRIVTNMVNSLNLDIDEKQKDVMIKLGTENKVESNYVGLLQEHCQKNKLDMPIYEYITLSEQLFSCNCKFGEIEETSSANNKKIAKQQVAELVCKKLTLS